MSKYISEFTSINGINYKVEIATENGNTTTNFILGGNPFVTTMDSDGKTIYAPIKTTGATIEMVTDKMPFDIYSAKNQGTKVTLTDTTNNRIEWVGYVTPCAYTQGFDEYRETIEIEAVDGIASLKDVPYRTNSKQTDSFINIIFKILKICNCYHYLYVTDNIVLNSTDTDDILSKIRISEENFFDEKEYENQPDDDLAWDCYDVLKEIMQYMGYTLIAQGDNVYIIDYDAIRNGRTNYFRYVLTGSSVSTVTKTQLSHSHRIIGTSYAENGTNISLSELFNKCTVVDEFSEVENVIDGVDNSKNFENITSIEDTLTDRNEYRESMQVMMKNGNNELEPMLIMIKRVTPEGRLSGGAPDRGDFRYYLVIAKFYNNPLINVIRYTDDSRHTVIANSNFPTLKYSDLSKYFGSHVAGYFTKCYTEKEYNEWRASWGGEWNTFSTQKKLDLFGKLCNMGNVGSKKLKNYIVCVNLNNGNHIKHDQTTIYPYFTINKKVPTAFGGEGGYIVINGKIRRHNNYTGIFPLDGKPHIHKDADDSSIYKSEGYVWARLKWGNKYWKCLGSYTDKGEWVDTPSNFKLYYGDPTKEVKVSEWLDKDISVYNNCGALWGVDDTGYYMTIPENTNLNGDIEFSIFANKDTLGRYGRNNAKDKANSYSGYPPFVMLYSDFEIKLGFSDDALNEDAKKADTVYENDVSGYNNINEMSEVKFKICTFDNKTASHSTTVLSDADSTYLDKTYNQATKMTLRQEEHFVVRHVSQYQQPRIIFECNLKNNLNIKPWSLLTDKTINNKYFIVDTMAIDYRHNQLKLQIIEKTNQYQ